MYIKKFIAVILCMALWISLLPSVQTKASSTIPEGAKEYNGNYYYVYNQKATWENAEANCEAVGGHLAVITSADEQTFIEDLIGFDNSDNGRISYIWIGAELSSDLWKWITGETWKYSNWHDTFPRLGYVMGKDYTGYNYLSLHISDGQITWTNYSNDWDGNSAYICEWESNNILTSLPSEVSISSVKKASSSSINITWKEVKGAEGYSVYMKAGANGTYKKIADIDEPDITTFSQGKLVKGKTYYFRVRAYKTIYDEKSYGELSGEKKLTLK